MVVVQVAYAALDASVLLRLLDALGYDVGYDVGTLEGTAAAHQPVV
jgi:hypothetical protein